MLGRECWLRLRTSGPRAANSHIWPKPGQIWGTLVRGNEAFPELLLFRHDFTVCEKLMPYECFSRPIRDFCEFFRGL